MADRYWVGGTAAWDGTAGTKWALTSGGTGGQAIPTSADDVFFSNLSTGTCTISAGNTGAKSINCTGFTGTIAGSGNITVSGSITLVASMTYTHTGTVTMSGTGTLTTAGKTFSPLTINGSGITVSLGDNLALSTRTLTVTQGTFNTSASNFSITAATLSSSNTNARTITLNGSTVTLSTGITFTTSTNLTFNAGTSEINLSGNSGSLDGGGQTFYNVSFTGTALVAPTITGANTFNNLTFVARSATGIGTVSLSANQTITGTLTVQSGATDPTRRLLIASDTIGTARTITSAANTVFGADFRDITAAGAGSWTDSSRTNYWGDCKGNSGITFATGRSVYWNLAGAQNWSATGWATTSGGTPAAANFPLAQDTVVFDNTSSVTGTITINASWNIGTVDMSGRTSAMTLGNSTNTPSVYGNWTNGSGTTLSGTSAVTFSGRNTQTITSASKTFTQAITINSPLGTVVLADALTTSNTFNLTLGTLNLANNVLSCNQFNSNNSNTRAIQFGTGNITVTGATANMFSMGDARNFSYTGTPTINISNNSATAGTISFGNIFGPTETNVLNFNVTVGTYLLTLSSSNRYKSLNFTGFTGTWVASTSTHTFYGSLTLVSGMTFTTGNGLWTFANTSGTAILTSAAKTLYSITVDGVGGTVQLADSLTMVNTLTLTNGTFNTANNNVNALSFSSSNSNVRTLNMGSGTWTITGTGTVWTTATSTNLTLNPSTSTIVLSDTSTSARTFAGGGKTYYNLTIGGTTGISTLTFSGSNTFNTLSSTKTVAHTMLFTASTTNTFTTWSVTGTVGNVVTIGSVTAASHTLAKAGGGTVTVDYASISRSTATPTLTWLATNSTDGGNNSGWSFGAFPAAGNSNFFLMFG